MTQSKAYNSANLRNRIEAKHNVTLLPTNDENQITYYTGGRQITMSPSIIRQYLVNGQGNVTDQEVMMFQQICHYQGLNPFLREAYLIKFGQATASIVVGKETFTKRAEKHPDFRGFEAGVGVITKDGQYVEREGMIVLKGEELYGGWARIYVANKVKPYYISAQFDEYVGRKGDGSVNGQWATKPNTMIRKVALVQALREAFPQELGGMYSIEEINTVDESDLPSDIIETPYSVVSEEPIQVDPTQNMPQELTKENLGVEGTQTISPDQQKRMYALAGGSADIVKAVLDKYNYEHRKDILTTDYKNMCAEIEELAKN